MNYIGSKYSLLPEIQRVLDTHNVPRDTLALDIFSGTGVVGKMLKERGHSVYANDWQYYSYVTSVAILEHNHLPDFKTLLGDLNWQKKILACGVSPDLRMRLFGKVIQYSQDNAAARVLSYLSNLPGKAGDFYDTYCEGGKAGRLYFSRDNGMKIQAIREEIELWKQHELIGKTEHSWLVACLLESADRVANTASVYGAYLKKLKRLANNPLRLHVIEPASSLQPASKHRAFCMDSEKLLQDLGSQKFGIVYIDPPYNARQYNANYHILETIARWDLDSFEPKGVTGLRSNRENKSEYCSEPKVQDAFRRLLSLINSEYVMFSYNNEGLVCRESLEKLFSEFCTEVHFEEIAYRRFRADVDHANRVYKTNSTSEYLVIGKMNRAAN